MSLINPTWEKIKARKRPIAYAIAGIAALGFVLWLVAYQDACSFRSDIQKRKEAVNSSLNQAKDLETNVNADKSAANQITANVKRDTEDYLSAVNATDSQRAIVNAAVNRMEAAKNADRNVNAEELEKILENLNP